MKVIRLVLCVVLSGISSVLWAGDMELKPIVVTANRYAVTDAALTSEVTVIGQESINQAGAKTIADLIGQSAGVYVTDNNTQKTKTVDIRGLGEFANRNVLVMIDGRKINPVDISGPDWLQIPTDIVERIEIVRGAASVLYGDNASAGAINIITKKSKDGVHGSIGASYGSFDTHQEFVQSSFGQGKVSGLVHIGKFGTKGYRVNSDVKAQDVLVKLGLEATEQVKFDLSLNWHEDYYGLPGALRQDALHQLGRRESNKRHDFGETRDRAVDLKTTLNPWPQEDLGQFEISTSLRNRDNYGFYKSQTTDTKYNIDTFGISGKYVLSRRDTAHDMDFVTGVDYYRNNNHIAGGQSSSDNLVVSKDDLGFFANGEYELIDNLYANAGTRYQQALYTFDITRDFSGGSPAYMRSRPDEQVSSGGLRYQYAEESNIFVDAAQSFRFLATDEWYSVFSGLDRNLQHQKGVEVQGGIKHQWSNWTDSRLTTYMISNQDEIYLDPTAGGGFGLNQNYDSTRRRGIEWEQSVNMKSVLKADVLNRWEIGGIYTWQDSEFVDGQFKGNRIPMTPKILGGVFTNFGFADHWQWRWDLRYTGDRYAINDEANATERLEPYTTVDTRLSYGWENVEIFGAVDNLFEQNYYSYVVKGTNSLNRNYYPAAERSYTVGVKASF